MTFGQAILQAILWTLSSLYVASIIARCAPRLKQRNRLIPAPSAHCERTGTFEVRMHGCALTRRQAD